MNTAELKSIIQEQEKERNTTLKNENIIERDVNTKKLERFLKYPNALAILGIRRCGKSILSHMIMRGKKYGYINFDDEALYGIDTKDLNIVLKAFYDLYGDLDYLVFDEIQNVIGWELFINRLRRTKRIIITGSNSQLLSGELATHLTGRHIDFLLFPFSFKEICRYKNIEIEKNEIYTTKTAARMEKLLIEYIKCGGLPESYKYGKSIVKSIFSDIVIKDIAQRHNLKTSVIESLAKYLITNSSNEISFNKLKNIFSIKKIETIKNYVKYFENAYLIFILERFSFKLKSQLIAPKKIYCMDTGIINSISFRFSDNVGKMYENAVCIELVRKRNKNNNEIFYWKDYQQNEVDFLIKKGTKIEQLIQVCYDISNADTKKRETNSLLKASKELKCKNMLIITEDYENEERVGGKKIKFIPLWKWLLS
ncbi:MAG: ATP-binding protein [Candidatus Aenigmatarchaeota archaeon]